MPDAVTAAPHLYKVVQENAQVRILDVRMKSDDKTEMHSHPAVVACVVTGGKFKFTSHDGQSMEIELDPGAAMYMDAVEHATENVGATEGHVILIELK